MWRLVLIAVVVIGLVLGLTAGLLNPQTQILDLFFVQLEAPLGMLVIAVFASGGLLGILFALLLGLFRQTPRTTASPVAETGKAARPTHE